MPLDIKIKQEVLNTGEELILTDITGVYTANNTGGYGTPNIERADHAVVFYAKKLPYSKDPVVVSKDIAYADYNVSYTNATQSKFILPYQGDGWYQFWLILVPTSYITPAGNDIRYNTATGALEIYTGTVSNTWIAFDLFHEDSEALILGGNYEFGFEEEIVQIDLITQKNCALKNYIDCSQCEKCKCEKYFEEHEKVKIYIQGIDYLFYSNKKYEAVKVLEKANKEFKCCK